MVVAVHDAAVFLQRRPPVGIWGGLWSLPEVADVDDWCRATLDVEPGATEVRQVLRHSFSHYDLDIQPVVVHVTAASRKVADSPDTTWFVPDEDPPGGIAAPVQQIISSLGTNNQ
jgi:A/G-specific adenine glycosylase